MPAFQHKIHAQIIIFLSAGRQNPAAFAQRQRGQAVILRDDNIACSNVIRNVQVGAVSPAIHLNDRDAFLSPQHMIV
ncbi:hypothetical protein D3C75_1198400 [compost metagenome]